MNNTYIPDLKGFYNKYNIYRRNEDGSNGDLIKGPTFTLRPYDPHARVALEAYATSVKDQNKELYLDIMNLLEQTKDE